MVIVVNDHDLSMSLRKQLTEILPGLLPSNPSEAIKGTELIRVARMQLKGNYSDASLRYHFSIMSCDPGSPIAKVEKGQGYYRRTAPMPALSGAQELISLTQGRLDELNSEQLDDALLRMRKFRAVVTRYFEVANRFPFAFRDAFDKGAPMSNLWRYPELLLVDWETGENEDSDSDMDLDGSTLAFKQRLGLPPFILTAARLRLQPSHYSYREDFFQTLAVSMWAQGGELIYAAPIEDEALANGLRHLNQRFGVGVMSFGLTEQALDDLPRPAQILNAIPQETEAMLERLNINIIATGRPRQHIDWTGLNALRGESEEVKSMLNWLNSCVDRAKAEPYRPDR